MKKFLSLVLALVMTMSLVTVSAGAKEFTDDDSITYDEAITVISTIGVVDGYEDGSFNPTGLLTRQAAAKIICNLILGPTTADALRADTAPFPDVPTSNPMSGYIAYCAQQGIINGYPNGNFSPAGSLTGYAFMKMLLGALGYDGAREGYTGDNWTIQVAKRAIGIGLDDGLEGKFDGTKTVNREEAALYALNMLQADLVEYSTVVSTVVNGQVINVGSNEAKSMTWQSSATRRNNIKNDSYIQFAEQFFTKLERVPGTDVFGRPSHTWLYDKVELDEYVDYEYMIEEYTKKVTYGDLYDAIGKVALDNCDFVSYVDGESTAPAPVIAKNDIYRGNKDKAAETGKGVLTQVFIDTETDPDNPLITVAVINTYLAKVATAYDSKNEEIKVDVYAINRTSSSAPYVKDTDEDDPQRMTLDIEDFPEIENMEKDDLYLVNVADRNVQVIQDPEILADSTINAFKKGDYVSSEGTQYDYADTAKYDPEVLDRYTSIDEGLNLKDLTYNIILDQYGYLIGVELVEDPAKYLFLTGVDQGSSNLVAKEADANAVFLDGTMATIKVNTEKSKIFNKGGNNWVSFAETNAQLSGTDTNWSMMNSWFTYTVNSNNVYTLTEVAISDGATNGIKDGNNENRKAAQFKQDVGTYDDAAVDASDVDVKKINNKRTSLLSTTATRAYGNDDTVYLNLQLKAVLTKDTTDNGTNWIVDDVDSVTTGVKNVNLTVKDIVAGNTSALTGDTYGNGLPQAEIYTLYNKDGVVIAAVTLDGEDEGSGTTWAYITSEDVEWEGYNQTGNNAGGTTGENEWTWKRSAIVNGEETDLIERGERIEYLGKNQMSQGEWYEIRYDGNGNVRKAINLFNFTDGTGTKAEFINQVQNVEATLASENRALIHDWSTVTDLTFKNGTLYTNTDASKGFHVASNVKTVLVAGNTDATGLRNKYAFKNIETGYTGYDGVKDAIDDMWAGNGNAFGSSGETLHSLAAKNVEVSAILNSEGDATVIIITDKTQEITRNNPNKPAEGVGEGYTLSNGVLTLTYVDKGNANVIADTINALRASGYKTVTPGTGLSGSVAADNGSYRGVAYADDETILVYAEFYWNVEVDEVTTQVRHGSKYEFADSVKGTGYIKTTTSGGVTTKAYAAYGDITVTDATNQGIVTGYVAVTQVEASGDDVILSAGGIDNTAVSSGTPNAGPSGNVVITGLTKVTTGANWYVKAGETITATFTAASDAGYSGTARTYTLTNTAAVGTPKTIAADDLKVAAGVANQTVTWQVPSSIAASITLGFKTTAAAVTYTVKVGTTTIATDKVVGDNVIINTTSKDVKYALASAVSNNVVAAAAKGTPDTLGNRVYYTVASADADSNNVITLTPVVEVTFANASATVDTNAFTSGHFVAVGGVIAVTSTQDPAADATNHIKLNGTNIGTEGTNPTGGTAVKAAASHTVAESDLGTTLAFTVG